MQRHPLTLLLHQARYDLHAVRANRQARFTTLFMPILLLVVIVGATGHTPIRDGAATLDPATFYTPGVITFAVLAASLMTLVIDVVIQRETGILKRRRSHPVPASTLVGARVLVAVGTSLVISALVLLVAGNGYNARIPTAAIPALVLTICIGAAALSAVAYALATIIKSTAAAQPVIALVALPLILVSGVFFPAARLPSLLNMLAQAFPLEHLAHGLRHAITPGAGALPIDALDLAMLAAWALLAAGLAAWRFQWLPQSR